MTANPIPEAVRVLVAELDEYLRGCPDPNKTSPKWMVRKPSRLLWRCRDAIFSLTAEQQPAAVDGAMLRKLRDYFEDINNDEDGDDYRNLSADAMDLIDSALTAAQQGEK